MPTDSMMENGEAPARGPIIRRPDEGRMYDMGRLRAIFMADGAETASLYSISEWRLDPHTKGPSIHVHPDDDVFYVLSGSVAIYIEPDWIDAGRGTLVVIPGGVRHSFENRSDQPAAFLSVSAPGGFEAQMPGIAQWFRDRPEGESRA